jgi:RHS repeat-associated protein
MTYAYDGNGNLVKRSNSADSSSTVYIGGIFEKTNTGAITKYYSINGRRVAMRNATAISYLLSDHLGSTTTTVSYVYGLGLISITAAATSYPLGDGLGSTTQLTNSGGAVTDSYTYDVFGATRSVTGTTANDFRFTGQQQDVSVNRSLVYLRSRSYDPALGRFLQQDSAPVGNRYSYVGNNPASDVDPYGSCGLRECLHDAWHVVKKEGGIFFAAASEGFVTPMYWAGWAEVQAGKGAIRLAVHCGHDPIECIDRVDMGAIGVGLIVSGVAGPVAACIFPGSIGIVASGGALVSLCVVSVPAGVAATYAGATLVWTSVTPWSSSTPNRNDK